MVNNLMNPTSPSNPSFPSPTPPPRDGRSDVSSTKLTSEQASTLLKLGLAGPRRPVDDLIDRLTKPDAADWLFAALEAGPVRGMGSPSSLLAHGKATLAQLESIKERSKAALKAGIDSDMRLAGIAGYFLALAAGLFHHHKLIGGRERTELNAVMLDLASVAPEPFSRLLSEAAFVRTGE
jgi:hypothetical protein